MNIDPEELDQLRKDADYGKESARVQSIAEKCVLAVLGIGTLYGIATNPLYAATGALLLGLVVLVLWLFFRKAP